VEDIKVARLDSIEIRSLWGEYDIEWQLKPDVNILVGVNGSGKSTLLEIIYHIVHEANDQLNRYEFDEVKLTFDDEQFIFAEHRYLPDSKKISRYLSLNK
jgi:predicted ATP-binding protein involved in virulence